LALLAQTLPNSGKRVMEIVREAALQSDYLVRAVGAPYDLRAKLKEHGYRWRPEELPNGKVWWTTTTDPEAEIQWLQKEIYEREVKTPVHEITALGRYSERIWQIE
jgi:DNA polymerase-3 subunit epsilon